MNNWIKQTGGLLQKGFTLVQLLIVVATVGILATLAVPEYENYMSRAKISELILAVGPCKARITEISLRGGFQNHRPDSEVNFHGFGCGENASKYGGNIGQKYAMSYSTYSNGIIGLHGWGSGEGAIAGSGGSRTSGVYLIPYSDAEGEVMFKNSDFTKGNPIKAWRCGIKNGTKVQNQALKKRTPSECHTSFDPPFWRNVWGDIN